MSNLTTILLIIVIGYGNIYVHYFVDRMLRERLDTVVSGVVRGVPISKDDRRMSLWFFSMWVGGAAGGHLGLGLFWLVAANNAVAADVQACLYICAVVVFGGMAAFVGVGILWHLRLAPVLRQAEAD